MHCNALAANNVKQQQTGSFHHCRGVMGVHRQTAALSAACVQFVFDKTSLASSTVNFFCFSVTEFLLSLTL